MKSLFEEMGGTYQEGVTETLKAADQMNGCAVKTVSITVLRKLSCTSWCTLCNHIEPAFAGSDLLNLRNQMDKIILIENLTIDQSAFVQYIALLGKGIQHLGCPLTELRCSVRIDAVANGNDCRQRVEFILIVFSVIRSLCKFCTN